MILYPALDLKDGRCVRLEQGDMNRLRVFADDPAAQARAFADAGAEWLHVVDLDGAVAGRPVNGAAVDAILAATAAPVQLGGGVRHRAAIDMWMERGVARLVLGTVALRDPGLVRTAARRHPGRIAVGIDARAGKVAVEGWVRQSSVGARDLALMFEDAGVAAIVYTDIDRDGLLGGVNVEATAALAEALSTPVIASGGVATLEDLRALKARADTGIAGVICGRALYDGRIRIEAALALLAGKNA